LTLAAGLLPLADLTIPSLGSKSAAKVLSAALRRLMRDLGAILHPASGSGQGRLRGELLALVRQAKVLAPGAVASVLRRADVGVWIRCLRPGASAVIDRDQGMRRLAWSIGRGLASVGGFPRPCTLRIDGPLPPQLASLAAREVVEVAADVQAVELSSAGMRTVVAGQLGELSRWGERPRLSPYAVIAGSLVVAGVDDNPLAQVEAHPDKSGNTLDLGDASLERWAASLAEALEIIGEHLPDLRREIDLVVQQYVPVGVDPQRHVSASYQEAIGTVYLSLHPQRMTMVEAVIHEFSHNKIGALFEVDPVLNNAFTSVHSSPVRPDPRPLHGVLLAVHAFLPVARLYERMIAAADPRVGPGGAVRLRSLIAGNHSAAQVILEHAEPTALGAGLVAEIDRWDRHFAALV